MMADREKVIKAIEICIGDEHCSRCSYHLTDYHAMAHDCRDQMMSDAIELLKEQETANLYKCPNCGTWVSAEKVVRCKDCKHGQYEEWDNGECTDKTVYCDGYGIHQPEWFCADGRKR